MGDLKLRVVLDDGRPADRSVAAVLGPALGVVPVLLGDGTSAPLFDVLARLFEGLAAPVPPRRFSQADGTLTDGQTVFAIPGGYTPGLVTVYRNGLIVPASGYAATNGTSITLTDPVASDDVIDVRAFLSSGAFNYLPAPHTHALADVVGLATALAEKASIAPQIVQDVDATVAPTTAYVGIRALTASRTISLPSATSYPTGQPLYIADESGACSDTRRIIIAAAGSDTIAGQPSLALASPYQKLTLHSNGSNLWTYA